MKLVWTLVAAGALAVWALPAGAAADDHRARMLESRDERGHCLVAHRDQLVRGSTGANRFDAGGDLRRAGRAIENPQEQLVDHLGVVFFAVNQLGHFAVRVFRNSD